MTRENDGRISDRTREWLEWVLITSIPLRRLDDEDIPIGMASGCLVDYAGRRFLLSVHHAVQMGQARWAVDLGAEPGKGQAVYYLPTFNYVGELNSASRELNMIDFCFVEVAPDLVSIFQNATPRGISDERARHVFDADLTITPSANQLYAFAGEVKHEMHGVYAVVAAMNVYPGLKFLRSEGEYHVFSLPVPHPGHEAFQGCSGAPIVDQDRNVVALVCSGDSESNTIWGVSLARYKFALDFFAISQPAQGFSPRRP
jgi:hypothetical protein